MPKYTTITELAEAFKSGELDASYHLVIDKGGCSLRLRQDGPPMPDSEEASQRYEHCKQLFRREYECPLDELFRIAGIPAQWA